MKKNNICSYVIPEKGKSWWQKQHRCNRPVYKDGRCKIHNKEKLERTRRRQIDLLIMRIKKLGGKVVSFSYGKGKENVKE